MELGWGGFDRELDMLILIRIPFSFHVSAIFSTAAKKTAWKAQHNNMQYS